MFAFLEAVKKLCNCSLSPPAVFCFSITGYLSIFFIVELNNIFLANSLVACAGRMVAPSGTLVVRLINFNRLDKSECENGNLCLIEEEHFTDRT